MFIKVRCSAVWPDWAIYWTLGEFLKPLATINLSKSPTFLAIFVNMLKSFILLRKSYLGKFCRHLAIFFWSHWWYVPKPLRKCPLPNVHSISFSCFQFIFWWTSNVILPLKCFFNCRLSKLFETIRIIFASFEQVS